MNAMKETWLLMVLRDLSPLAFYFDGLAKKWPFLVDLQIVNISLRVLSRPDSIKLPAMYRQLGTDYDERVLPSICNEVCKCVASV